MQQDKTPSNEQLNRLLKELQNLEGQEAYLEYDRLQLALDRGRVLLKIKKELPHGSFLPFLKSNNVKLSPRSAERYMQLAKYENILLSNSPVLANLTVEKALKLISSYVRKEKLDTPVQIVPLSKFAIISSFDAQSQEYLVTLKIAASVIELLSRNANMKIVNAALREALLGLVKSRNLTDLSTFSEN